MIYMHQHCFAPCTLMYLSMLYIIVHLCYRAAVTTMNGSVAAGFVGVIIRYGFIYIGSLYLRKDIQIYIINYEHSSF